MLMSTCRNRCVAGLDEVQQSASVSGGDSSPAMLQWPCQGSADDRNRCMVALDEVQQRALVSGGESSPTMLLGLLPTGANMWTV
jgi:hypothetical protein